MIRAATFLIALMLSLPLSAQTVEEGADPQAVLEGFRQLVDNKARPFFGLPLDSFWRRQDTLDLALLADDHQTLEPVLQGAAEPFAAATGREISVAESGPAEILGRSRESLAPEAELVIVIAPRPELAEFAANNDFNLGMLAYFESGAWPFMFHFQEDAGRRGVVLLADDEPARAREAAFILATVWALGGVTLGPELEGLVTDSEAGPQLTPVGESVFRLFFHEDLAVGMPIGEAVQRAATLLAR